MTKLHSGVLSEWSAACLISHFEFIWQISESMLFNAVSDRCSLPNCIEWPFSFGIEWNISLFRSKNSDRNCCSCRQWWKALLATWTLPRHRRQRRGRRVTIAAICACNTYYTIYIIIWGNATRLLGMHFSYTTCHHSTNFAQTQAYNSFRISVSILTCRLLGVGHNTSLLSQQWVE